VINKYKLSLTISAETLSDFARLAGVLVIDFFF
jgi:hypothetical protein